MPKTKVFCIGMYKTGTMSLGRALVKLGYNVCPMSATRPQLKAVGIEATNSKIFKAVYPEALKYNGFRNHPWSQIYRECSSAFPDAKFILTERKIEHWIPSVIKHFSRKGNPAKSEAEYKNIYSQHAIDVRTHFASSPDRLLILNLEDIDWKPLCSFLGVRRPIFRSFPHRNQTKNRSKSHLYKVLYYEVGEVTQGLRRLVTGK
jgi:hypothetical protein